MISNSHFVTKNADGRNCNAIDRKLFKSHVQLTTKPNELTTRHGYGTIDKC